MNEVIEQVQSNAAAYEATSTLVRFVKVSNNSGNANSPKYRASISLQGALKGAVLEAPIFQDAKSGGYSVSLPGGRFAALKPEPMTVEVGGVTHILATPSEEGTRIVDGWADAIRTAFLIYLKTGNGNQRVSF